MFLLKIGDAPNAVPLAAHLQWRQRGARLPEPAQLQHHCHPFCAAGSDLPVSRVRRLSRGSVMAPPLCVRGTHRVVP
jgi:hypothetical protein